MKNIECALGMVLFGKVSVCIVCICFVGSVMHFLFIQINHFTLMEKNIMW
jgi:hypothetical protein